MRSLRYTQSAEDDLFDAWLFIAEKNPDAADQLLDTIVHEATSLLSHPAMGRKRPELAKGLRSWPTKTPYVLFYIADAEGVLIVRVLHHARDLDAIAGW